ncbi:MAG TPA: TatD family hydrolase [Vicinamibacterales bacterium]|nr:TatD family hydrolase [Vicinamibacterales bacterium]
MLDSHCHLAGEEFAADLEAVAARAAAAGVVTALCILEADDEPEVARAAAVRAAWPGIHFAAGIHPHHTGRFASDAARAAATVRGVVAACQACAIGEIGLDYHYDFSPRDVQQEIFRAQIRLALDLDLPIIIHTREAMADTLQILREEGGGAVRGVFHCFTGDVAIARQALGIGFYLSYAGILTFPKAGDLREAAKITPPDRLLSETDSPYLAPVPYRGKRNEPAYVPRVVETLAELHRRAADDMARQIAENFARLFGGRREAGRPPGKPPADFG